MKKYMYSFFVLHASKIAIVLLAAGAGEAASFLDGIGDHPALTSVLGGVGAALLVKYFDKWLEGRNKTIKTADEVLKIEAARQERLEKQQAELIAEKEAWYKTQNDRLKVEFFEKEQRWLKREEDFRKYATEAMEINHAANSELMRQQRIILGLQHDMLIKGIPIPEVTILEITKYMLPAWQAEKTEKDNEHAEDDNVRKTE